jgi:predicted nucleotidyltransferase
MGNKAVLGYLDSLCRKLKLSKDEKEKIETSVAAIRGKLITAFFDDGLKDVRVFGSFDRGTLLSRGVDESTDVDILIIFDEKKFVAQTYLNKLKKFAETNYARSDSYQDHPTMVIELNHITFELVPCIVSKSFWGDDIYTIPKKKDNEINWIETDPDYYKKKIIDGFPTTKDTLIKMILLFKYWNLLNSFPYSTYQVEKYIIEYFDYEEDLQYNLLKAIYELSDNNPYKEQNEANRQAQTHRSKIILLLENNMEEYALMELSKLLPEIDN